MANWMVSTLIPISPAREADLYSFISQTEFTLPPGTRSPQSSCDPLRSSSTTYTRRGGSRSWFPTSQHASFTKPRDTPCPGNHRYRLQDLLPSYSQRRSACLASDICPCGNRLRGNRRVYRNSVVESHESIRAARDPGIVLLPALQGAGSEGCGWDGERTDFGLEMDGSDIEGRMGP